LSPNQRRKQKRKLKLNLLLKRCKRKKFNTRRVRKWSKNRKMKLNLYLRVRKKSRRVKMLHNNKLKVFPS